MSNFSIAVVLTGCGFKDGSEITESVAGLIALSESKCQYEVFAPDKTAPSFNHITGEKQRERNILVESARIARQNIKALSQLNPDSFHGALFPGGFGAVLHLCNWAEKGSDCHIDPDILNILRALHSQKKPIAAFCIAPALVAKALGIHKVAVTIGEDAKTASEIEKTGAEHKKCPVDGFILDAKNKIVTTPAYMYGQASPFEVFTGIRGAVKELVKMANE